MKNFMDENFLLSTETARHLFHDYAKDMPIIDYHCHLSVREIAENKQFSDIGELLLAGDHYKWRGMAACGYTFEYIRSCSFKDRFMAYAKVMPKLIGNPLYHWTHLELQRVFDIYEPLSIKTAEDVWNRANEKLATEDFRARKLIERFNVKLLCTTDDPVDDLSLHRALAEDKTFPVRVLPSFRPDKALNCHKEGFAEYMAKLAEVSGIDVSHMDGVLAALENRLDAFHALGARISDHALDIVPFAGPDMARAQRALTAALAGEPVDECDAEHYRTAVLVALGKMYEKRGWTQQYHMNALRNTNTPLFKRYGPDTGGDTVNNVLCGTKLAALLDAQESTGGLPRTILYSLNPADNYTVATIMGSFQGGIPGKLQFGSAWWFGDQLHGMEEQLRVLASVGVLAEFVGMLTDSRSFVSYPRHEYFRRLLCEVIGKWVENGEYPADEEALKQIVQGICYYNAKNYFGIPVND